jgi:hypothetical protein
MTVAVARLLATVLLGACLPRAASAQAQPSEPRRPEVDEPNPSGPPNPAEYLFAPGRTFSATVASGFPFLGIGELAYSVTDRFAIGAFGAATPDMGAVRGTMGIGVRPRGILFLHGEWRSVLVVPVLYYPRVPGFGDREPWMLARPTIALEKAFPPGLRLSAGVGLIAAACTDSLLTLGKEHTTMGGVWNTASLGGAVRLSARASLFGEASLIMRGATLASDWIGRAPVIVVAGMATTF